jgi:hypothetical protein
MGNEKGKNRQRGIMNRYPGNFSKNVLISVFAEILLRILIDMLASLHEIKTHTS